MSFLSGASRRIVSFSRFHRVAQRALLILSLLLCAGCFETKLSLESDEKAQVDAACLGKFAAQSGNEHLTLIVRDLDHRHYLAKWTSTASITSGSFVAHTSKIAGATFANLRRFSEKDGLAAQQIILRTDWSSDHNTVTLRHLKGKFFEQITTDRDFRMLVEQSINNPSIYESAATLTREVGALEAETADEIVLAKKLLASTGGKSTPTSRSRSEDSLAVERHLRARFDGGATENQIIELSDAIAEKFDAAHFPSKERAWLFPGTGEKREVSFAMLDRLPNSTGSSSEETKNAAKQLIQEIDHMIPPRAVFNNLWADFPARPGDMYSVKPLPAIEGPILRGYRAAGSLRSEHLAPSLETTIHHLTWDNPAFDRAWEKIKGLRGSDVLECSYQGGFKNSSWRLFFWYKKNPDGLDELLKTLPADHPIREIGLAQESAPATLELAVQANPHSTERLQKGIAEEKKRAERGPSGPELTNAEKFWTAILGLGTVVVAADAILTNKAEVEAREQEERVQKLLAANPGAKIKCPKCGGRGKIVRLQYGDSWATYEYRIGEEPSYHEVELLHPKFSYPKCDRCDGTGVINK